MIFDIIGLMGVTLILVVYGLVHLDRIDVKKITFSVLNAIGAALILVSLYVDYNLPAVTIEVAWILISLYGIYAAIRRKKS
ncbi:MAG: hypothetical protein HN583_05140 [Kordiimonadaceae bacterium]|jgi:hypothetical protein|nr:hypothetical protein [Kordiimonadaceae bacterium]MDC0111348.1 hypothetical protein [Emcibacteraceae bacterium]MBT6135452.1 hypothetical protein [Kordiimonadaceae bacterium]MBT6467922.1 hypothetical protein [Kordiimonadaceae bacterium]MBT7544650.1 hypothetical protein [Kordiimonadaceae bacterium]|tara:strand:+ start:8061 stop:8303 length:243 start_codon:yes stop_codon:yes gene_type:complete